MNHSIKHLSLTVNASHYAAQLLQIAQTLNDLWRGIHIRQSLLQLCHVFIRIDRHNSHFLIDFSQIFALPDGVAGQPPHDPHKILDLGCFSLDDNFQLANLHKIVHTVDQQAALMLFLKESMSSWLMMQWSLSAMWWLEKEERVSLKLSKGIMMHSQMQVEKESGVDCSRMNARSKSYCSLCLQPSAYCCRILLGCRLINPSISFMLISISYRQSFFFLVFSQTPIIYAFFSPILTYDSSILRLTSFSLLSWAQIYYLRYLTLSKRKVKFSWLIVCPSSSSKAFQKAYFSPVALQKAKWLLMTPEWYDNYFFVLKYSLIEIMLSILHFYRIFYGILKDRLALEVRLPSEVMAFSEVLVLYIIFYPKSRRRSRKVSKERLQLLFLVVRRDFCLYQRMISRAVL